MCRFTFPRLSAHLAFCFLSQFAFAQNKCSFGTEKNASNILEYRTGLNSLEYPLCYYMMANVSSDKSRGSDRYVGLCTNYEMKDGECLDGMSFCCCKGNPCNCKKEEQNHLLRQSWSDIFISISLRSTKTISVSSCVIPCFFLFHSFVE